MDASGHRLNERDIGRTASELLAANGDRRKRNRTSSFASNGASHYGLYPDSSKKRRSSSGPSTINTGVAAKAAAALMRESPSYKRLVEMEERLNLAIMRKQQDIREALKQQSPLSRRIFRLYIFNTYRSQPGTEGVTDEDVPSWSLRIQGQLLPLEHSSNANMSANKATSSALNAPGVVADTNAMGAISQTPAHVPNPHNALGQVGGLASQQTGILGHQSSVPGPSMQNSRTPHLYAQYYSSDQRDNAPRCSDIFKRIVIELDDSLYAENNLIEWQRNERDQPAHGFEISRQGSEECAVRIFLDVNHYPELYKLSVPLSRLLGVKTDTRSGIFVGVWQYIKKMRLQSLTDRTAIRLDTGLKSLLTQNQVAPEIVKLHHLYEVVKSHMAPPDRLEIVYNVKLSGNVVDNQDCYDIQVNMEDRLLSESVQKSGIFGMTYPSSFDYQVLEEKHVEALEKIALHKRRRDFFEGFYRSPVEFINHLTLSQTRDLKVLGGSTGRNPEEERRASFYQQQWVHEAIPRYLLRKAIADTAKKTSDAALKQG